MNLTTFWWHKETLTVIKTSLYLELRYFLTWKQLPCGSAFRNLLKYYEFWRNKLINTKLIRKSLKFTTLAHRNIWKKNLLKSVHFKGFEVFNKCVQTVLWRYFFFGVEEEAWHIPVCQKCNMGFRLFKSTFWRKSFNENKSLKCGIYIHI